MMRSRDLAPRFVTTLAVAGALFLIGCADDGLGQRYPVSGSVTYKGEKVPTGTVNFIPSDESAKPATGEIKDGSYSLTTLSADDGAFPGKYKVTIESLDIDLSAAKAFVKSKGGDPESQLPQELIVKARKNAKSNIPTKYAAQATSPLTAEVGTSSNTIDFPLED